MSLYYFFKFLAFKVSILKVLLHKLRVIVEPRANLFDDKRALGNNGLLNEMVSNVHRVKSVHITGELQPKTAYVNYHDCNEDNPLLRLTHKPGDEDWSRVLDYNLVLFSQVVQFSRCA